MTINNNQASALFLSQEGSSDLAEQTLEEVTGAGWGDTLKRAFRCFGRSTSKGPVLSPRPLSSSPPSPSSPLSPPSSPFPIPTPLPPPHSPSPHFPYTANSGYSRSGSSSPISRPSPRDHVG